jgi:hypothetical protein
MPSSVDSCRREDALPRLSGLCVGACGLGFSLAVLWWATAVLAQPPAADQEGYAWKESFVDLPAGDLIVRLGLVTRWGHGAGGYDLRRIDCLYLTDALWAGPPAADARDAVRNAAVAGAGGRLGAAVRRRRLPARLRRARHERVAGRDEQGRHAQVGRPPVAVELGFDRRRAELGRPLDGGRWTVHEPGRLHLAAAPRVRRRSQPASRQPMQRARRRGAIRDNRSCSR